jgi:general secretion pathway protein G
MKINKKQKKLQKGFSLIEILVVLFIIGLLTTIVAVNVLPSQDKARVSKAKVDIAILGGALELYRLEHYRYPNTEEGLKLLLNPGENNFSTTNHQGYIKSLPKDPWGNDYIFLNPGEYGEYDLFSLGADGQSGGEGLNQDIGNWTETIE